MFFGKKKTQLEKMIDENGIDFVAAQLAILINEKIPSIRVAEQFVLEELDAARQGNDVARRFVENSGYDESEYKGAMNRSFEEVDGPNGPQQFILGILTSQLSHDMNQMVNLRCKTVNQIMEIWNLGKYSLNEDIRESSIDNTSNGITIPNGGIELFALLNVLEKILIDQMWHVQKIDYTKHPNNGVLYAIVAQAYLKFNGPDIREAKAVEASECTLGIIENNLDVLPTVLMQLSFNFCQNDIEAKLQLFDSRPYGGYTAIRGLSSLVDFNRDELLGSFADANPNSQLEQLLKKEPLFESIPLLSRKFHGGIAEFADHLPELMYEVGQKAIHATINL